MIYLISADCAGFDRQHVPVRVGADYIVGEQAGKELRAMTGSPSLVRQEITDA